MIERVYTMGSILSENAAEMSKEEIEKYKKFLKSEMEKMENPPSKKGKNVEID
jgi:hypothetical protein